MNLHSQVLILVFLLSVAMLFAKPKKDWNKINKMSEDEIDNDEKEPSLLSEIAAKEKKRKERGITDVDNGPIIIFVDLKTAGRGDWGKSEMQTLAKKWITLLHSASLVVDIWPFSKNQMLAKILHGWMISEIQDFILNQVETKKVLRDKKDVWPTPKKSKPMDDDDDL